MAREIILFQNPKTNQRESLKVGFNFFLLFFASAIFGLFLYLRGMYKWGMIATILNIGSIWLAFGRYTEIELVRGLIILIAVLLHVYLAINGNELTAKWLLKRGFVFADPDSQEVAEARRKWKIE